jgi:hypothetical protein
VCPGLQKEFSADPGDDYEKGTNSPIYMLVLIPANNDPTHRNKIRKVENAGAPRSVAEGPQTRPSRKPVGSLTQLGVPAAECLFFPRGCRGGLQREALASFHRVR